MLMLGGGLSKLRKWWDSICYSGPAFDYFLNAVKSHLVLKEHVVTAASPLFSNPRINISSKGYQYLTNFIGTSKTLSELISKKVSQLPMWVVLSPSPSLSPNTAFCGFTHGHFSKCMYLFRTTPLWQTTFSHLKNSIRFQFLPVLTGH